MGYKKMHVIFYHNILVDFLNWFELNFGDFVQVNSRKIFQSISVEKKSLSLLPWQ